MGRFNGPLWLRARPSNSISSIPPSTVGHRLRRYRWRTFLNLTSPLLLVGFYAFICLYYLNRPPENGIVQTDDTNARWVFYLWFLASIFVLDWAKTALAKFEAAALMEPRLAPTSAMELMWHGDANWSNFLWWLRAIRSFLVTRSFRLRTRTMCNRHYLKSTPDSLWIFLSTISLLIFAAVPLSGLTIELATMSSAGQQLAPILGPNPRTFNLRGSLGPHDLTRGRWRNGELTTPADASIFYAPEGTANVSNTYFHDRVQNTGLSGPVRAFLGPAVTNLVAGNAWGVEAEMHCRQVRRQDLQLLQISDINSTGVKVRYSQGWSSPGNSDITLAYNETGVLWQKTTFKLIVAADGTWYGDTPYSVAANHDMSTIDAIFNHAPEDQPTTAVFEAYLWQGCDSQVHDAFMQSLLSNESSLIDRDETLNGFNGAGYSLQCSIKSAVGNATVDPGRRTYRAFTRGTVAKTTSTDQDTYPLQVLAVEAFGNWDINNYAMRGHDGYSTDNSWITLHLALGIPPYFNLMTLGDGYLGDQADTYRALMPVDLTLAIYKLFGNAMITMMSPGCQEAWYGGLHELEYTRYIVAGVIGWQYILALFGVWASVVFAISVWLLCTKRWSPTLGSFEFFRLGAQYTAEVNHFDEPRFEACASLQNIPGMIGVLPGEKSDGTAGFIGLSENMADPDKAYVFDRKLAAMHRIA